MLAETDPAAFEERRTQLIRQFIEQRPVDQRRRLECLQWRIDMERRRYRHPLASALHLYEMMWESVNGERGLLAVLGRLADNGTVPCDEPRANVLPFRSAGNGPR